MALSLSMGPRLIQTLKPRISLLQLMQTQQLISMPPTSLDLVLNAIELNPRETEAQLKELGCEGDSAVQSMFGDFVEKGKGRTEAEAKSDAEGFVVSFPMKGLSELVKKEVAIPNIPDVTYVGRKNEKPEIRYANHLIERPRLEMALLDEFPEAGKLYKLLCKEREWISRKLREFYANIGNSQREFIFSLDPVKLNVYDLGSASRELKLHLTTVSRLRKSRYLSILDSEQKLRIYPATALMPNKNDYLRVIITSRLNKALGEEAEKMRAFTDEELTARTGYGRRTITKHRILAGIPNSRVRAEDYRTNPSLKYEIPLNLEVR